MKCFGLNYENNTEVDARAETWWVFSYGLPQAELRIGGGADSRGIEFSALGDRVLENFFPVDAVVVIFDENAFEQFFKCGWNLGVIGYDHFFILEHFDQLRDGFAFEGTFSKDHLIEYHSNWPNIGFNGIDLSFDDFGGHVYGRAEHGLCQLVGILERLAEAEVCYLDAAIIHEYVIGLDVPVHDIAAG